MNTKVIQDTHVMVYVTGEIDLYNVAEFRKAIDEALERSPEGFIIDLTDATYLDSAGLQAIIAVYRKINAANGNLALVVGNVRIRSVLKAVRLDLLPRMSVEDDLDTAKQAMSELLESNE